MRTGEKMLDWIEEQLARRIGQARFWMIVRAHPQVGRLADQKDRDWALWYATASETIWRQLLRVVAILVIGPAVVIALAVMFFAVLRWTIGSAWPFMLFALWVLGLVVTAIAIEARLSRRAGRSCFRAMRLFGYDICPNCGYEMAGHSNGFHQARTCPECGEPCPPTDAPGRSTHSDT